MNENQFLEFQAFRNFLLGHQFELTSHPTLDKILVKVDGNIIYELDAHKALYIGEILVIESRKILDRKLS